MDLSQPYQKHWVGPNELQQEGFVRLLALLSNCHKLKRSDYET